MITKLGRTYGQSFLDTLGSTGAAQNALEQLRAVVSAMEQVPALRHMAANPGIPLEVKHRALIEIGDSLGLGQSVGRLLEVLLENYRFGDLPEIVEAYEELLRRQLGIARARVVTASPMDESQREEMRRVLVDLAGSEVEVEASVDPGLVGGFVATVGSTRYDTSLRGQLERMERGLASPDGL